MKRRNLLGGLEKPIHSLIGDVEGNSASAKPTVINQALTTRNNVGEYLDSNYGPWIHLDNGKNKFLNSWLRRDNYNTFKSNTIKMQALEFFKAIIIVNEGVRELLIKVFKMAGGISYSLGVRILIKNKLSWIMIKLLIFIRCS